MARTEHQAKAEPVELEEPEEKVEIKMAHLTQMNMQRMAPTD